MSGIRALWRQIGNLFHDQRAHDRDLPSQARSLASHHCYRKGCADTANGKWRAKGNHYKPAYSLPIPSYIGCLPTYNWLAVSIRLVSLPVKKAIAGDKVSTIPANQIERNREKPCRADHLCVLSVNHSRGDHYAHTMLYLYAKCGRERMASTDPYPRKIDRRQECATVSNIDSTALPIAARSVREGLASSDTTPAKPPSAPESAPTDSGVVERTTVDFYLVTTLPNGCNDDPVRSYTASFTQTAAGNLPLRIGDASPGRRRGGSHRPTPSTAGSVSTSKIRCDHLSGAGFCFASGDAT